MGAIPSKFNFRKEIHVKSRDGEDVKINKFRCPDML
jgi:hypothetical protein